jgi:hypothetical protein
LLSEKGTADERMREASRRRNARCEAVHGMAAVVGSEMTDGDWKNPEAN